MENRLGQNTIIVVLGPSSAGKSTYIFNKYLSIKKDIPVIIDYELLQSEIQEKISTGIFKDSPLIIHFNTFSIYGNYKKYYDLNADFRKYKTIKFLLETESVKNRLKIDIISVNRKVLINRIITRNHVEPLLFPNDTGVKYPRLEIRQLLKRLDLDYEENKWCTLWKEEGIDFIIIPPNNETAF